MLPELTQVTAVIYVCAISIFFVLFLRKHLLHLPAL